MTNPNDSIFDSLHDPFAVRRRQMVSTWVKVFCWLFIAAWAFVLVGLLMVVFGGYIQIPLYGLRLDTPIDMEGIIVIALYTIKGIVAIALLTERDWAVIAGMADALLGIAVCLAMMVVLPFFNFRFHLGWEIIFLLPYYTSMWKIKYLWREDRYTQQQALHNNYQ